MQPQGQNFFTPDEISWLTDKWLIPFSKLDGKRKSLVGVKKGGQAPTQAQEFTRKVVEAFDKAFPYRHPRNATLKNLTDIQKHLIIDEEEWVRLDDVSILMTAVLELNMPLYRESVIGCKSISPRNTKIEEGYAYIYLSLLALNVRFQVRADGAHAVLR